MRRSPATPARRPPPGPAARHAATGEAAHGGSRMPARRRWLSVLLRTAHVVAVIGFAAQFLGGNAHPTAWAMAVLGTGLALFAHDISSAPTRLYEISSASVLAKLALVAAMGLLPAWQTPLFWAVVVWSVIFAHAPASFRHARLRRRAGG